MHAVVHADKISPIPHVEGNAYIDCCTLESAQDIAGAAYRDAPPSPPSPNAFVRSTVPLAYRHPPSIPLAYLLSYAIRPADDSASFISSLDLAKHYIQQTPPPTSSAT